MKKKKLLIALLAGLTVIAAYRLARLGHETWLQKTTSLWTSIDLGTGQLDLRYSAGWAFAPHDVIFYYRGQNGAQFLGRTDLHNDGANLGDHNVAATNQGNGTWLITLKGEEQRDETWRLQTAGRRVKMEKLGAK